MVRTGRRVVVGKEAGGVNELGYRVITVNKRRFLAHRLAWFYVNGVWPDGMIDHVNQDQSDNRIENLRIATKSQNMANDGPRATNTSGYRGVTFDKKRGKWVAMITKDYKVLHLGRFLDREDAARAYDAAAISLFGEFACLNFPSESERGA